MKKEKPDNNYFSKDTEQAIIRYNNTVDNVIRDKIFREEIYFPFYKLVENIIHTFKFYYTDVDDIEDLKLEIISLLVEEKIHLFDPTNGAKAYSYFGTIIKRHLINYNNKNYKKVKNTLGLDVVEDSYEIELKDYHPQAISLPQFMDIYVEKMYKQLPELFPRESERHIAGAVLNLFEKRYDLELFRKKALYIYIREMTGTDTPYLTKVINVLKKEFYKLHGSYSEISKIYAK